MAEPDKQVLLVEYQKAQDSAQYHDSEFWSVTGSNWAGNLVLLGFAINNVGKPDLRLVLTAAMVLSLALIFFQLEVHRLARVIKKQKYARCREIEEILGMQQHRNLEYPAGYQTIVFRIVNALFLFCWTTVLFRAWR